MLDLTILFVRNKWFYVPMLTIVVFLVLFGIYSIFTGGGVIFSAG